MAGKTKIQIPGRKFYENLGEIMLQTLGVILLIWFTLSTIEVASKNLHPNPKYSSINMWVLLTARK